MRRSKEEAAETRRKIVEAASRLFRAQGVAEIGVADAMGALGLTVGGFYKHFASKEALVVEAIEAASLETTAALSDAPAAHGRRAALERYLSDAHIANPAYGCPVAALAGEAAHGAEAERGAMRRAVERSLAMLGFARGKGERERRRMLVDFSTAVGAVVLARALKGVETGDELIAAVRAELLGEE
jgi:TetR/AcrR family transcriptional repressor of nem operon